MDLDQTKVTVSLRLLKMLEWRWSDGTQVCGVCGEVYKYGHRHDCSLALAIQSADPSEVRIQPAPGY